MDEDRTTGVVSKEMGNFVLVSNATAWAFSCKASCRAMLCIFQQFSTLHLTGDLQSADLWSFLKAVEASV